MYKKFLWVGIRDCFILSSPNIFLSSMDNTCLSATAGWGRAGGWLISLVLMKFVRRKLKRVAPWWRFLRGLLDLPCGQRSVSLSQDHRKECVGMLRCSEWKLICGTEFSEMRFRLASLKFSLSGAPPCREEEIFPWASVSFDKVWAEPPGCYFFGRGWSAHDLEIRFDHELCSQIDFQRFIVELKNFDAQLIRGDNIVAYGMSLETGWTRFWPLLRDFTIGACVKCFVYRRCHFLKTPTCRVLVLGHCVRASPVPGNACRSLKIGSLPTMRS